MVSSRPRPVPGPALKRVPRWRTMISPPVTRCPPNTFTPRRCAWESRPLRLDPNPFLCAIGSFLRVSFLRGAPRGTRDLADLQAREIRAMPHLPLGPLLRPVRGDADLRALQMLGHHRLDLDLPEVRS